MAASGPLPPPHALQAWPGPCLSLMVTLSRCHPPHLSGCPARRQGYSRGQETPGTPGQCQAGDEADDQVQDKEQEVGKPSVWTGRDGHGRGRRHPTGCPAGKPTQQPPALDGKNQCARQMGSSGAPRAAPPILPEERGHTPPPRPRV